LIRVKGDGEMKESRRSEIDSEIEKLRADVESHAGGNFWIGLGAIGLAATVFGLQGDDMVAGFGLAVSFGILIYGFVEKDRVKKAEEKMRFLQKQLDFLNSHEKSTKG